MVKNFPKTEKIEIRMKQSLANKLPKDKKERNAYIVRAVEYAVDRDEWMIKAHSAKSPAKSAAARENGKKGGRPKKSPEMLTKETADGIIPILCY